MPPKDSQINDINFQKFVHNDEYYRGVFKKTEKIISVVFYILNNIDIDKKSETHTSNLASKAHFAHENALRTLEVKPSNAREALEQFAQSLIGLKSTLTVVSAARVVAPDTARVVENEIDLVLRNLKSYLAPDQNWHSPLFDEPLTAPARSTRRTAAGAASTRHDAALPSAANATTETPTANSATDRRMRIMTILEAKGEASIKDISEIVNDISEKTIQRELNAMIEEGHVKRQGERRWSKYSMQ